MSSMAPDSGMGGILKKLLPRLVGDLGQVPEERMAGYLDHLSDRLTWVRHGGDKPAPAAPEQTAEVG